MNDELEAQILWFESLLDAIEDGELEDAEAAINAALKLLRRNTRQGETPSPEDRT